MAIVKLGDVAHEYKTTIKNSSGYPIVGLEHLTPSEIDLVHWDENVETTFSKGFKKGHVLFGRRRAYLKKAAVAPFDGICSGDIIVIEAEEDRIRADLLPFIIQNDLFFDYAMSKSAGGLSPRVKWADLKEYEFNLPPLIEQESLVDLLSSAYETKKAYLKLIDQTEEIVKSQFIEMFKDSPEVKLGDLCELINGDRSKKNYPTGGDRVSEGIPFINAGHLDGRTVCFDEMDYITEQKYNQISKGKVKKDDILYCLRGSLGKHGLVDFDEGLIASSLVIIRCDQSRILPEFLLAALESDRIEMQLREANNGTSQPNLSADSVKKYMIPQVPFEEQKQFVEFFKQSDKSKFVVSNRNLSRCLVTSMRTLEN